MSFSRVFDVTIARHRSIAKPTVPEAVLFRIEKNLRNKHNERIVRQADRRRELFELQREKLVHRR